MADCLLINWGSPGGPDGKESACNAGDPGLIPGSGRSHGEGNGNPLQYSCLENLTYGGPWWARVSAVTESRTRLTLLSMHTLLISWTLILVSKD